MLRNICNLSFFGNLLSQPLILLPQEVWTLLVCSAVLVFFHLFVLILEVGHLLKQDIVSLHLFIKLLFEDGYILWGIMLIKILAERAWNSQVIRQIIVNVLVGKGSLLPGVVAGAVGIESSVVWIHEWNLLLFLSEFSAEFFSKSR